MSNNQCVSFGIYLGNSSCCISVNRNGNAEVVANASGERVTPAVVGFHDSEVVTGTAAKQGLMRHEKGSVVGALHAIGSTTEEQAVFPLALKCQVNYDSKRPKFIIQNGDRNKTVMPDDVLKHLLQLLKGIAGSHSNDEKLPAVITLPAWVSDAAISAVHYSASLAGFQVIKTISQASAAALAYDLLDDNKEKMNVLMFHCGGTTTVATVVEIAGGLLSIKETSYTCAPSGDAITSILVEHFAKEFFMKYKGDPLENRRSKRKLYNVAENCKHVLSTMNSAQVHAESLWEGVDFSTQLSRARFDGLASPVFNEVLGTVKEVLQRANLNHTQIAKVVLTGGTCKIPKLQNMFSEMFRNSEILKRFPADEILAIGAAKESEFHMQAKSKPQNTSASLVSCLSIPIYVKVTEEKLSECIFPSGTPTHSQNTVSIDCPTGPCSLMVYEATEPTDFPAEDQILAQIELNFIDVPTPVKLQIECALKSDGSLVVNLLESLSKTNKSFIIEAGES